MSHLDILAERAELGFKENAKPYANCICSGCRSPVGWNRCAGPTPEVSTIDEHAAALSAHRQAREDRKAKAVVPRPPSAVAPVIHVEPSAVLVKFQPPSATPWIVSAVLALWLAALTVAMFVR